MREIVRSENSFGHQQFAGIEWNPERLFNYHILVIENSNTIEALTFNENIEWLYKKWMIGEDVHFTIPTKTVEWNVEESLVPQVMGQQEKNEYLARKVQKLVQQQYSLQQQQKFEQEIEALATQLDTNTSQEQQHTINEAAKALDEKIKQAVALTKNISLEQKWHENGISSDAYFDLKPRITTIFDKLKKARANNYDVNYNTISPKVEAAFAQSKTAENFNETRKDLIALQKELIAIPLERWQKNELMTRLNDAFDHINGRQDAWRKTEDDKRAGHTATLQQQYDTIIPQALSSSFSDGFGMLKDLQELTNKSSIQREKRDFFYNALNEAFTTLKQKADGENEANYTLASKQVEVAIVSSQNAELFKDSRSILTAAQNELKDIRLSKKQKDELFGKIRTAFDELNKRQDAFYNERKKENRSQLENVLTNFRRILSRKIEGIENLYQAKSNIEAKKGMIKISKNSTSDLAEQFEQRLVEITQKIEEAEKDIVQLEQKVQKIEGEINEARK
jgi:hypothetical protein